MTFPLNPVDGQLHTNQLGTRYKYSAIRVSWLVDSQEITGATGSKGDTGSQGCTGPIGVTGLIGETGAQGNTGTQGETGPQGLTGLIGETGSQGHTGTQGITGSVGVTGLVGPTGTIGETGAQGTTGLANFIDVLDFPAIGAPPILLWNEQDEALYVGITGVGKWVQISAGSMQGATGLNSLNLKSFTMDSPTASENITLFYIDTAITITAVRGVLYDGSGTPSVTIDILHAADRSTAGTSIFAAPREITSISTGDDLTLGGTTYIPANRFIWFVISAKSGTVPEINVTMFYNI